MFVLALLAVMLSVDSSAFWNGGSIPPLDSSPAFGCIGRNVSPPLRIAGLPAQTRSLGVVVYDTDAHFVHWVAYGITPRSVIPTGFGSAAGGYVGGRNDAGTDQYVGPCPPAGDAAHHYVFTVYATSLDPAQLPPGLSRAAYLRAVSARTLASGALTGTFAR
jgi:Raf kinase inhibitor-like YbhB/YbcL family protein